MTDDEAQSVSIVLRDSNSACEVDLHIPLRFTAKQIVDLLTRVDRDQIMICPKAERMHPVLFAVRTNRPLDENQPLTTVDIQDTDLIELRWNPTPDSYPISRLGRLEASGCKANSFLVAIGIGFVTTIVLGIVGGLIMVRWPGANSKPAVPRTPASTERFDVTARSTRALVSATPLLPTDTFAPSSPTPLPPTNPTSSLAPTNSLPPLAPTATSFPFSEGPVVFGHSAGERDLFFYRLGTGPSDRAIIGGIHGGYEWNTTVLVSQTLEYLQTNPEMVPVSVTLYIIPLLNPDGFIAGRDAIRGRMNANGVDLNRNWDYQWQMTATHGLRPVSGGAYPFSEPETAALRDLILDRDVEIALVYHSGLSKIFSAADTTRSATIELAEMMSEATGYPYAPEGVPGQITTGDAIDWMSTQGITAIEVELTDHDDPEWERNIKGIIAFLNWKLE
jgi:hypothetical protein